MQIFISLIFSLNMQAILERLSSNWAFAIAMTDITDTQFYGFTSYKHIGKQTQWTPALSHWQ